MTKDIYSGSIKTEILHNIESLSLESQIILHNLILYPYF